VKSSIHPAASLSADLFEEVKKNLAKREVLLLLPGGSAIPIIEELLKLLLSLPAADLEKLTVTTIDERYEDDPDHAESNYLALATLPHFTALLKKGMHAHQVLRKGDTLTLATRRFDQLITKAVHSDTYVIGCLGVANDYHIAGILPHKEEYYPIFKRNYVTGYDIDDISMIDNPSRYRITLNFNGMMQVDDLILFAVGPSKWRVLKNLVAIESPTIKDISRNPVFVLHELKKKVRIYTDQEIY
jgi:6-phosphogluconolactonase/glucosamine-6-phosphate isomerase/deaminase